MREKRKWSVKKIRISWFVLMALLLAIVLGILVAMAGELGLGPNTLTGLSLGIVALLLGIYIRIVLAGWGGSAVPRLKRVTALNSTPGQLKRVRTKKLEEGTELNPGADIDDVPPDANGEPNPPAGPDEHYYTVARQLEITVTIDPSGPEHTFLVPGPADPLPPNHYLAECNMVVYSPDGVQFHLFAFLVHGVDDSGLELTSLAYMV